MRKEVLIALHHAIAMEARRINREQVVVLGRLKTSTPSSLLTTQCVCLPPAFYLVAAEENASRSWQHNGLVE